MAVLATGSGDLYYEVVDLTPPWLADPPTILFHHGVGTNADIWSDWLPILASDYRLVRFDLRGFGRSDRPTADNPWSLDGLVDDLLAVADASGSESFHLVGESVGGTVALYAAACRPERLTTVTALSCSHKGGAIGHVREWRGDIDRDGMEAWSRTMMERRFRPGAIPAEVHDWFHREQAAGSPDVILGLAEMLIGADLSPELPEIDLPVLLLAPAASPFVPPEIAADIQRLVPGAELMVFESARHGLACSHGRACAEALRDFLVQS